MHHVTIKIINNSENELPAYATEGASGMDLRANVSEPVVLKSMERAMIPTGIFLEIPLGFEVQVRPRSGLAWKNGITCLNSPGTVDSDYRGELKVIMVNLSMHEHTVNKGDRIAQMVVCKVEKAILQPATELEESIRGHGGFGHTGTH
jgi:dUTP pyrophosphatase